MKLRPQALNPGSIIGVISPASPITKDNIDSFEDGLIKLKRLGYKIILGKHTYYNYGYLAGTDKQRAYDLMEMFNNKDVSAIICSRGGYGTERLISNIDLDVVIKNPKIFIGYSNITFLLNVFSQYADIITFHGPMVKDIGTDITGYNVNFLIKTIALQKDTYRISPSTCSKFMSLVPGKCTGTLIGGNLTTFISSLGTRYEIDTTGKILLLEDVGESAYRIDRMLTILKNLGKLDDCSGIIIGDFVNCEESYGRSVFDVFNDILVPLGKPTIYNVPVGHGHYNVTMPIGAKIELDAISRTITVLEPVVML